jgi:predicted enzyme related to lactoylglutathione lyase
MDEKMGKYVLATTTETDEKGMIKTPGNINGGFFPEMPGVGTTVVIGVDNLEESIQRVQKAGGSVLGEVMDIPGVGKYVAISDTEDNRVGMLQPLQM